jgi:hypothetical protein
MLGYAQTIKAVLPSTELTINDDQEHKDPLPKNVPAASIQSKTCPTDFATMGISH